MKISLDDLKTLIVDLLASTGLDNIDVKRIAEVYYRTTLRGVGHHDIHDLLGRIKGLREGRINPLPEMKLLSSFGALETYDGDNGMGEWATSWAADRAVQLAKEYGLGLCSVRNTGHYLCSFPYVESIAEEGMIAIACSKTEPLMSGPGSSKLVIGNGPMGFAAPVGEEDPFVFDACLSYASIGKMKQMAEQGEAIPEYWAVDPEGKPCSDPSTIFEGGVCSPIGGHKGFALSMLIELLTSGLSLGALIDQAPLSLADKGSYGQTVLVINSKAIHGENQVANKTAEMIQCLKQMDPELGIPGERSKAIKKKILEQGYVELEDSLLDALKALI